MDTTNIKKDLLLLAPHWNYHVTKPLKQMLNDDVNLEMYYCLQALHHTGTMTMTEFSQYLHIPTHKMSKIANRLYDHEFIEREYDPKDRRIIRIKTTEKVTLYLTQFYEQHTNCFQEFLEKMTDSERIQFGDAVHTLLSIFFKMQNEEEL